MYEDKRQTLKLSKQCWECLETIKNVSYANTYTFFLTDNMGITQRVIRSIAPGIQGDRLRFKFEGKMVTFSLSNGAIKSYKPKIQEFSCFGSAVKVLGAYENYIREIVKISNEEIPDKIKIFKQNHKNLDLKDEKRFINHHLGRGIDFLDEVFGFSPHPSYKPSLQFMFELRNVAVHNSGIIDKRLYDAANNDLIEIKGDFRVGNTIEWNLSNVLQLIDLVNSVLSKADPYISDVLELPTIAKRAFVYIDKEIGN